MIVIGDVHGCYKTFLALLEMLPKDRDIYLVGDVIDRGPGSREMIEYLINHPEIRCVRGNHEGMMIKTLDDEESWMEDWMYNGGNKCLDSYKTDEPGFFMEIPEKHDIYVRSLPMFIETNDVIISHSGDIRDNWNRGCLYPANKKFHIFGHTPVNKPIIGNNYANIDTGCVFDGYLTAILYPEMTIYQQINIDINK